MTTLERVARAVYEQEREEWRLWGVPEHAYPMPAWDELPDHVQRKRVKAARMHLEALMKPTPEMLQKIDGWISGGQCAETAWKETITAALKETAE